MLTYPADFRVLTRGLLLLSAVTAAFVFLMPSAQAQERRYLFEVGAAGALQSYNNDNTGIDGSFGVLGRLGVWLPLNFSAEVEGSLAKPEGFFNVKVGSASLLYNVLLGSTTWGY